MYMDDVKIFVEEKRLETTQITLRIYSHYIRMEFEIKKCAMLIIKKEKKRSNGENRTTKEKKTLKHLPKKKITRGKEY